jgi:hypothetical protein
VTDYILISTASLLFLVLLAWAVRSVQNPPELAYARLVRQAEDPTLGVSDEPQPAWTLHRIFAPDDARFIAQCHDENLLRLFRRDRKRIALRWIGWKQVQAAAILREHLKSSRRLQDVQILGELDVLFRYLQLRLLCTVLAYAVFLFGPQNLYAVAGRVNEACRGFLNFIEIARSRGRTASA